MTVKKSKTLEEVRQLREENAPKIFNMTLALEAIEATTPRVYKSGARGDFSTKIIELFKSASKPLAVNQVVAAFKANGEEVTNKMVADRLWVLSDRNKKNKAPLLKAGADKGVYELV